MSTDAEQKTDVGSYFVSNYPPFSVWSPDVVPDAIAAFSETPENPGLLGMYMHIPFCRKRCKFCYYRVYTDKKRTERDEYLDSMIREMATYREMPVVGDRPIDFLYVGGGTPSALHETQIDRLGQAVRDYTDTSALREVTFECEPGTMTQKKVEAIKAFGCTRLSLGVEHFDDHILEENGRAHLSPEIFTAYEWVKDAGFAQVNIDLIAGMVDETDATWKACIDKAGTMNPDSITIYQMELPYNTVYSRQIIEGTGESRVAGWEKKREWAQYAFDVFTSNGYVQSSAYTLVKEDNTAGFHYRDALWEGADLASVGVASFGHLQGYHYQNNADIGPYNKIASSGELPIYRAYKPTANQRLIREMVLQLKKGHLEAAPFEEKFGVNILDRWGADFGDLRNQGFLDYDDASIALDSCRDVAGRRSAAALLRRRASWSTLHMIHSQERLSSLQTLLGDTASWVELSADELHEPYRTLLAP